jgi:hypothetical protein
MYLKTKYLLRVVRHAILIVIAVVSHYSIRIGVCVSITVGLHNTSWDLITDRIPIRR